MVAHGLGDCERWMTTWSILAVALMISGALVDRRGCCCCGDAGVMGSGALGLKHDQAIARSDCVNIVLATRSSGHEQRRAFLGAWERFSFIVLLFYYSIDFTAVHGRDCECAIFS
jgi:hypothetical protein